MNITTETQGRADASSKIFGQGAAVTAKQCGSNCNAPVRVLIVEDMSTMRSVVRNGIKQTFRNAEIEEAVDGADAQRKLQAAKVDLIISDWEMPHVSGVDLLKWVRSHPTLKNIPFIMVTANHQKECVQESMHLGVNAFLLKPFTVDALTNKMGSLIERFNRREFERFNSNCPVRIINPVDKREIRGELIDVSCGGFFATFPRTDYRPYIFDDVGIEISYNEFDGATHTVRLTGFVIRLQSATTFRDSDHIKLAVKFDDHAVQGNKDVEKFFEHLR
jgi:two-component system, chemotaxis family, chemotaxis protein CheY